MQSKELIRDNQLVSVVVPIYNSEDYLQECIDSIINQTYHEMEIILVNDGSTDGSSIICESYANIDKRIIIINQENSGASASRKNAIRIATGELITFIDSDDYIEHNYIETLIEEMKDSDLITSGLQCGDNRVLNNIEEGIYEINENSPAICNMIYAGDGVSRGILTNMCGKIFKTVIAKKVIESLDTDIYYGEDAEFVYKYILACDKIKITKYCGYFYRVNNLSVSHTFHDDFLINVNKLYLSLKKEFENSIYRDILIPQLEKWIALHIRISFDFMRISKDNRYIDYVIPYKKEIAGKNVVVYGAGNVGKDFIRQIVKEKLCDKILWVDQDWKYKKEYLGENVYSPEQIKDYQYDYIILAVNNIKNARSIMNDLESMKIEKNKIIWERPLSAMDFYN